MMTRNKQSRAGMTIVETAVIAPVGVMFFMFAIDLFFTFLYANQLQNAAYAGATYLASHPSDTSTYSTIAQSNIYIDSAHTTISSPTFANVSGTNPATIWAAGSLTGPGPGGLALIDMQRPISDSTSNYLILSSNSSAAAPNSYTVSSVNWIGTAGNITGLQVVSNAPLGQSIYWTVIKKPQQARTVSITATQSNIGWVSQWFTGSTLSRTVTLPVTGN